jgi:hypothetical protein
MKKGRKHVKMAENIMNVGTYPDTSYNAAPTMGPNKNPNPVPASTYPKYSSFSLKK